MYRYFQKTGNTDHILVWKSKGLSDNNPGLVLNHVGNETRVKFYGSCLKQDRITLFMK